MFTQLKRWYYGRRLALAELELDMLLVEQEQAYDTLDTAIELEAWIVSARYRVHAWADRLTALNRTFPPTTPKVI